jgi:hypothetical protein
VRDNVVRSVRTGLTKCADFPRSPYPDSQRLQRHLGALSQAGGAGLFNGEPIVCGDDSEATEKAKRLVDGHDVELWNGPKLVVRLDLNSLA